MALVGENQALNLLARQIELGEAFLVLGAGASRGCTKDNKSLPDGRALAAALADRLGMKFSGEPLRAVCDVYEANLGKDNLKRVFKEGFTGVQPSPELVAAFKYTWRRVYTWNIDDAIKKASHSGVQKPRFFNGMRDMLVGGDDLALLDIVFLHGDAKSPEAGFVFTNEEYNAAISNKNLPWYGQLIEDYRAFLPVFVGTSLDEPILETELYRASRAKEGKHGRAILITPDNLTEIQRQAYSARGIVHLRGTFADFLSFLAGRLGDGRSPSELAASRLPYAAEAIESLNGQEKTALNYLYPVRGEQAREDFGRKSRVDKSLAAKRFLLGFPANWQLASSDVPVSLSAASGLKDSIQKAHADREGMFVVTGPLGSSKTTSLMQALTKISSDARNEVFEVDISAPSLSEVVVAISKLSTKRVYLYIPVLYPVSGVLSDVLALARKREVLIVTTARDSEWGAHLANLFVDRSVTFPLRRLKPDDYPALVDRIREFVPAPAFNRLERKRQIELIGKSNQQLLIALREATEGRKFDELILEEFQTIPTGPPQSVFAYIGIGTIARVGVRPEMIAEIFSSEGLSEDLDEILEMLSGIIYEIASGRLFVRHELYARRVFLEGMEFKSIIDHLLILANYFSRFKWPILRNISRADGILFKAIFNHDFVRKLARTENDKIEGLRLFEQMEIPFQFDGHFWLQYGLYLADLGRFDDAIDQVRQSLRAYPENAFAKHTLAVLMLRHASEMESYNGAAARIESEAIGILRELDARHDRRTDVYPLVTMAILHTNFHVKHERREEAKKLAKSYLAEVQRAYRSNPLPALDAAKQALMNFLTFDIWERPTFAGDF